ncbi:hypothetical protein [Persephonella hydrogeniphila]|nr:hypothetical protein [Persephonella hydrogeniphila]
MGKLIFGNKTVSFIIALSVGFLDIFVVYDTTALKTTSGIFFIFWGFYFYLKAINKNQKFFPVVSGLFLIFSSLIYINFLPVLFSFFVFLIIKDIRKGMLFVIPVIIVLSIVTYRNYTAVRDFILVSGIGGIHFYIGNSPYTQGGYYRVPNIRASAFGHYFDGRKVAEKEMGKKLKPSEVNKYWRDKALSYIISDPDKWLFLELKKLFLVFNNYDIPNNIDKNFIKEKNRLLRFSITFGVLSVFGLSGFLFAIRDKKYLPVHLLFILYTITVLLFFVTDRYRLPLVLPLIVYTGIFLNSFATVNKQKKLVYILPVFLFSIIVFFPVDAKTVNIEKDRKAYSYQVCSIRKKIQRTEDKIKKSSLYTEEAIIYIKLKGYEQALFLLNQALYLNPENEKAKKLYKFSHKMIFNSF